MYRIHLHEALAFRGQLLFYVVITLLSFTLAYYLWSAIFSEHQTIGGYSREAMITYYFLATLFENVVAVWIEFGMERIVRDGTLTTFLLRPMNFLWFQFFDVLAWKTIYCATVVLVYGAVAVVLGSQLSLQTNPTILLMTGLAMIAALGCFFFISFLISLASFWLLKIDSVVSIARYTLIPLMSGAYVPVTLFPQAVQAALRFTPFPYLVGFPANVYLGRVGAFEYGQGILVLCLWMTAFCLLTQLGWKKALQRYEAVGA